MIGYWGYLEFEVNDDWWQYPTNIIRTAAGRWSTHNVIGQRPVSEFQGAEEGTFTFTMHFDQRFTDDVRHRLDELVTWVNEGYAAELVIGTKPMGFDKWKIVDVKETITDLLPGGLIFAADAEVKLVEQRTNV
jgi:phage protein U|nr:MAG TPA: hypothetical protein [Caudoviricetes sp.]